MDYALIDQILRELRQGKVGLQIKMAETLQVELSEPISITLDLGPEAKQICTSLDGIAEAIDNLEVTLDKSKDQLRDISNEISNH